MGQVDVNELPRKSRRKACDLCFMKKIKCDRAKPLCSHCKIYGSASCTYTPLTRTPNPKAIPRSRADVLETRLRELEARLKAFEGDNRPDQPDRTIPTSNQNVIITDATSLPPDLLALTPESLTDFIGSEVSEPRSEGGYALPPLRDILPSVSSYFNDANRVVPLFHEPTFMRMLRDWYPTPTSQLDPAIWAAINIVLALSRRHTYIDISSPRGTLDVYVRNAQAVLNQLVTREEDLLGIQVVLGLAFIFYGTSDPKPATVLVATAVRLAHSLRINTLQGTNQLDPDIITQRQRIFWILYTLDRDVALRIRQPAMLHENDIDLELPEESPPDGVGIFFAENGTSVNFFRKRVQFAWIQGKVYEWLFSVRAEKLPLATRDEHSKRLERALDQWHASLPAEFKPDMLPHVSDLTTFRAFMVMHFTRLQVLARVHHAYAYDSQWLETLRGFSQAVSEEHATPFPSSSLPDSFQSLVVRSRENMKLFALLPQQDLYILWSVCCAFFSSVIFLLVNSLAHPHHGLVDEDLQLIDFSLQVLQRLEDGTGNAHVTTMHRAIAELDSKTRIVIDRARSNRLQADSNGNPFVGGAFDDSFMDPAYIPGTGSNSEESAFAAGAFASSGSALDAELFGSWMEAQLFDASVSYAETAPAAGAGGQPKPNFDGVVATFLKQSWF
ncbi:fungal-specific transcription factor [Coniochaeta sp. 2T2.1]|nr:fungal-specific transcription factor [Coniochaeta sp. 2T2.1]